MYPNPQQALPLPVNPNVEQYRKLAKDLVKACKSGEPAAVREWAVRWIERLAALQDAPRSLLRDDDEIRGHVDPVVQFAQKTFSRGGAVTCSLADAQFVIARAHGFLSWPRLVKHVESLAHASSTVTAFERAASAIVTGDAVTLRRVLRDHPALTRARSTREHGATLLHYVSANGVEGYRQVSPSNAAEITEILLAAGADVDAEADVYEGRCTPLGLVATSAPPFVAKVQREVIDVLLSHGARVDAIDKTWGTPPLIWALTGWDRQPAPQEDKYYEVVARLVAAGANVTPELLAWDKTRANARMLSALTAESKTSPTTA